MENSLFIAKLIQGGFTWTIANRIGAILWNIENIYGSRDKSYTLLGVEFIDGDPHIWYPGDRQHIVIQLSISAMTDENQALYQLAHECVHLLSPSGERAALVIEEGAATAFSEDYVSKLYPEYNFGRAPRYAEATRAVRALLTLYPGAIRRLRAVQPAFRLITPETFGLAGLEKISTGLVDELLSPF